MPKPKLPPEELRGLRVRKPKPPRPPATRKGSQSRRGDSFDRFDQEVRSSAACEDWLSLTAAERVELYRQARASAAWPLRERDLPRWLRRARRRLTQT